MGGKEPDEPPQHCSTPHCQSEFSAQLCLQQLEGKHWRSSPFQFIYPSKYLCVGPSDSRRSDQTGGGWGRGEGGVGMYFDLLPITELWSLLPFICLLLSRTHFALLHLSLNRCLWSHGGQFDAARRLHAVTIQHRHRQCVLIAYWWSHSDYGTSYFSLG